MIARLQAWLLGLCAVIGAVLGALWLGRRQGKQQQRQAAAVAGAAQEIHAHEVRDEVEAEVQKLPDAPPQKLADADPATAAGHLRDAGWLRD